MLTTLTAGVYPGPQAQSDSLLLLLLQPREAGAVTGDAVEKAGEGRRQVWVRMGDIGWERGSRVGGAAGSGVDIPGNAQVQSMGDQREHGAGLVEAGLSMQVTEDATRVVLTRVRKEGIHTRWW